LIRFTEQQERHSDLSFDPSFFQRLRARFPVQPLFAVLVLLPTVLTAFYYLIIAAPIYVSDAKFLVRTPSQSAPGAFDSLLVGVGLGSASSSVTDAYVVEEYVTSRDAVRDLEKNHDLRGILSKPSIDFIGRYPRPTEGRSFEDLYQAYRRYVTVGYDGQTGISTLRVYAFDPHDAAMLANALLDGGERLINRLNDRADADAVANANRHILDAEARVEQSEAALTSFRNRERLIDPTRSSLAGLDLVGKLEGQVVTLQAQRAALAASAPESPQLPIVDQQIQALQAQTEIQRSKIAGQDTSLAPMIGEYERLTIDRDFAAKELTAASAAVESAELDMRRKRLYLERVVPPNIPDAARMPRRMYSIGMVFLSCLLIYGIVSLIIAGLREHTQQ